MSLQTTQVSVFAAGYVYRPENPAEVATVRITNQSPFAGLYIYPDAVEATRTERRFGSIRDRFYIPPASTLTLPFLWTALAISPDGHAAGDANILSSYGAFPGPLPVQIHEVNVLLPEGLSVTEPVTLARFGDHFLAGNTTYNMVELDSTFRLPQAPGILGFRFNSIVPTPLYLIVAEYVGENAESVAYREHKIGLPAGESSTDGHKFIEVYCRPRGRVAYVRLENAGSASPFVYGTLFWTPGPIDERREESAWDSWNNGPYVAYGTDYVFYRPGRGTVKTTIAYQNTGVGIVTITCAHLNAAAEVTYLESVTVAQGAAGAVEFFPLAELMRITLSPASGALLTCNIRDHMEWKL